MMRHLTEMPFRLCSVCQCHCLASLVVTFKNLFTVRPTYTIHRLSDRQTVYRSLNIIIEVSDLTVCVTEVIISLPPVQLSSSVGL